MEKTDQTEEQGQCEAEKLRTLEHAKDGDSSPSVADSSVQHSPVAGSEMSLASRPDEDACVEKEKGQQQTEWP